MTTAHELVTRKGARASTSVTDSAMTWDELVACALVGTARRSPVLPEELAGLPADDPEGGLLAAGAMVGLYRQAGIRLRTDPGPGLPLSPEEVQPYCSEVAAGRLPAMLDGGFRGVLPEWLGLLVAAGRLVPPARLPGLLAAASVNPALRPATLEVAGERGRWLGGLNPAWAWAAGGAGAQDAETWATGSAPARRLLLGRLRATDPAAALDLLRSTWATETPEDRAAFVAVLAAGLSLDDEPFLEAALDDRRKEVRQAAATLLWRLPESRLGQRMAARARRLVGTTVTMPTEVDAAMIRDGIAVRPPSGRGERAWRLYQVVAATPLSTWASADLVAEADPLLRQAWATAAARQQDATWALALLDTGDVTEPALLAAVPHDRAVALAAERVAADGLTAAVLDLLAHCPIPWGHELSGLVVERLGAAVKRRDNTGALRPRLTELALRLDPSAAPLAIDQLADHWFALPSGERPSERSMDRPPGPVAARPWSDVVGWFLDLLTFRAAMREEIF